MKVFIDYRVDDSKPMIYVNERWKLTERCKWRGRAAFIHRSQQWEIRKFVGPHTCTSAHMTKDHRKLDSKTICKCILIMVKYDLAITVSMLITTMQERSHYRVSYQKAWLANQMAMDQLYGDCDASYNESKGGLP